MQDSSFSWQYAADVSGGERALLERLAGDWGRVSSLPGASMLKENQLRTVLRLAPEGAACRWVVKLYRHGGFYDRWRGRLFSSRAAREYKALERLRAGGFPVPRPLAFALRRQRGSPVEGGLVMEEIAGAVPLSEALVNEKLPGLELRTSPQSGAMLFELGQWVRRLLDRGIYHPDLHGGNVLVAAGGKVHLIDLHSCRFPGLVPGFLRRRGLARVVYSLRRHASRDGLLRLILGFQELDPPSAPGAPPAARVEPSPEALAAADRMLESLQPEVARLARTQLRSRTRRCVVNSTVFETGTRDGLRYFRRRTFEWGDAAALIREGAAGEILKLSPRGSVRRVDLAGRSLIVKHRLSSWTEAAAGLGRSGHRLRRAWVGALGLEVRGVPTPPCLALVERRVLGLVREAWLIQEAVPGGVPLDLFLRSALIVDPGGGALPPPARRRLAAAVGRLLRRCHDAGIRKHDWSPQNLLVAGAAAADVRVVDLDDVGFRRRIGGRRRQIDLAQVGNMPEGHIHTGDLLRALKAYDGGGGAYYRRGWILGLRGRLLGEAARTLERMTRAELPARPDAVLPVRPASAGAAAAITPAQGSAGGVSEPPE